MYQCAGCRKTFSKQSGVCPYCGVSFIETKKVNKLLPSWDVEEARRRTKARLRRLAWGVGIAAGLALLALGGLHLQRRVSAAKRSVAAQVRTAVASNDFEQLQALLNRKAKAKSPADHAAPHQALRLASEQGNVSVVRFLLDKGIRPRGLYAGDEEGTTALMLAAEQGHEEIVRLLLEKGANIKRKDIKGRAARQYALAGGKERIVVVLDEALSSRPRGEWSKGLFARGWLGGSGLYAKHPTATAIGFGAVYLILLLVLGFFLLERIDLDSRLASLLVRSLLALPVLGVIFAAAWGTGRGTMMAIALAPELALFLIIFIQERK